MADPVQGAETMTTAGPLRASLIAWDPRAGREAWRVDQSFFANGGTLATAGDLVLRLWRRTIRTGRADRPGAPPA